MKQRSLVERLQDRLSRAQEEILSLQSSLAQSASHYQNLQMELMDKANQAAASEKEVTNTFFSHSNIDSGHSDASVSDLTSAFTVWV